VINSDRLRAAYITARDALLAERVPAGHWVGELSTSALSTATAVMALHLVDSHSHRELIAGGIRWLCENQNTDGGWGDTTKSFSNISTTMLCRAALEISRDAESAERSAVLTARIQYFRPTARVRIAGGVGPPVSFQGSPHSPSAES
jgi:squalene-hopene/tetraprenyl-beta-curcumene cyclase